MTVSADLVHGYSSILYWIVILGAFYTAVKLIPFFATFLTKWISNTLLLDISSIIVAFIAFRYVITTIYLMIVAMFVR